MDIPLTCDIIQYVKEPSSSKEVIPVVTLLSDRIVVSGKEYGLWLQIFYNIADLRANANPIPLHPADDYYTYPTIPRTRTDLSFSTSVQNQIAAEEEIVSDWEFTLGGMALTNDDAALPSACRSTLLRSTADDASGRWRLMQLYSPGSISKPHTGFPQLQPSFVPLVNPVLGADRRPLLDVSYNFAVWIEEVPEEALQRRRRFRGPGRVPRCIKIATFPRPSLADVKNGISITTLSSVKTSVLRRAFGIFIRPSLASIFILTSDSTLYCTKFI